MLNIMEHNEWLNCYWPLKRLEKDQISSCFPFQPIVLLSESSVGPNIQSVPKGTFWWMTLVIYSDNISFLLGALSPFSSKEVSFRNTPLMGEHWAEVGFQPAVVTSKLRGWEGDTAPSTSGDNSVQLSTAPLGWQGELSTSFLAIRCQFIQMLMSLW